MQRAIALPIINLGRLKWNQDLADAVIGMLLAGIALYVAATERVGVDALGMALLVVQTLPVAFRRRNPMRILFITGLAITIYSLRGYPDSLGWTGVFLAFYTVAANEPRRLAVRAALVTAGGIFISLAAYYSTVATLSAAWMQSVTATYAMFGVAWLLGDNLRVRRAYTRQLEERAAELEKGRQDEAIRAVAEERSRIARELHDVVAHYVSVMVVQSAGRPASHRQGSSLGAGGPRSGRSRRPDRPRRNAPDARSPSGRRSGHGPSAEPR